MNLVIDGYNFIHAVKRLESKLDRGLKEARDTLISFCNQLLGTRKDIAKIFIVFDGTSELYCSEENPYPKIRIIYTPKGEDADDRIIEILRTCPDKNVTVVTNDNYVTNHSRSLGARVLSAADFENCFISPKRFWKNSGANAWQAKVTASAAKNITDEYKKFLGIQ